MKYLFQIFLFFAMTPAAAADQDLVQIKTLCVKSAQSQVKKEAPIDAVCECSIKRTLERLRAKDHEVKDPKARITWLKKMYELKLSQSEIDADEHGIFDFNTTVTETCLKELKAKKDQSK